MQFCLDCDVYICMIYLRNWRFYSID